MQKVRCDVHGLQAHTLVCQHITEGLDRRERVGFYCAAGGPDNPRPDAWCLGCEERVKTTGYEWVGLALEHLEPMVLCGGCYDLARQFHTGGNPWS